MNNMTKEELIRQVYEKGHLTMEAAKAAVDALFGNAHGSAGIIIEAVAEGREVRIAGFGQFSGQARKKRNGRNPQTGELVLIPAKIAPKFEAGKRFRDSL